MQIFYKTDRMVGDKAYAAFMLNKLLVDYVKSSCTAIDTICTG